MYQNKMYSQTEINEAEEEYPDEEVADEIPDHEDTEDEQEHRISEEEGHVNESKEVTTLMKEKLRPIEMLQTSGAQFQEEDSYHMQMFSGKQRPQTTMTYHPNGNSGGRRQLSGQNQYDPMLTNQSSGQRSTKQVPIAMTSLTQYGTEN